MPIEYSAQTLDVVGPKLRHLQRLRCFARNRGFVGSSPNFGSDVFDLAIGHRGQPCQDMAQVAIWLDTVAAATLNDRVDNRTPFSGVGGSSIITPLHVIQLSLAR
jgi:hypothetical protein